MGLKWPRHAKSTQNSQIYVKFVIETKKNCVCVMCVYFRKKCEIFPGIIDLRYEFIQLTSQNLPHVVGGGGY